MCLGHQAIGQVFGGRVGYAPQLMHGKTSRILHRGEGLFEGLPSPLTVTRYHSLVLDPQTVSAPLVVDASAEDGTIMGVHHHNLPVFGVQFHPESFMSEHGPALIRNFIARTLAA